MTLRELALVSFTLLMQASVGIVLVVAALPSLQGFHPKPGGMWPLVGRLGTPLGVAAAAAALGLLASLLHLGQPILAWFALANVRGSWLSREIALAIVFVAALAVLALSHAGDRSLPSLRMAASVLAAVAGLALVFSMARLYMIGGQPAWDRFTTPATFFASTLLLGLVAVVALGALPPSPRAVRVLASTAVALLAVQVLLVPALLASVPSEPAAALGPASVGHAATWLAAARIGAAIAGAGLLVTWLRGGSAVPVPMHTRVVMLTLVVVSEIVGRVLFYASSVRLGPV
jgi:anaerobic dimethyl sulfoxide reductase subunit C (anchor subunit)